jgi:putative transcription factor
MSDHQDWTSVVWKKSTMPRQADKTVPQEKLPVGPAGHIGKRSEEAHRLNKIEQKSINGECDAVRTVSRAFSSQLQRARLSKAMTQKALASAINEKVSVINEYECGKAVMNQQIIQKLNKVLGVQLVSNKSKKN